MKESGEGFKLDGKRKGRGKCARTGRQGQVKEGKAESRTGEWKLVERKRDQIHIKKARGKTITNFLNGELVVIDRGGEKRKGSQSSSRGERDIGRRKMVFNISCGKSRGRSHQREEERKYMSTREVEKILRKLPGNPNRSLLRITREGRKVKGRT